MKKVLCLLAFSFIISTNVWGMSNNEFYMIVCNSAGRIFANSITMRCIGISHSTALKVVDGVRNKVCTQKNIPYKYCSFLRNVSRSAVNAAYKVKLRNEMCENPDTQGVLFSNICQEKLLEK